MINTEYPESVEESGQYLRIALKRIGETKLPYNPVSYLMWYEYATGRDELLSRDMGQLLKAELPISFDIVSELFKKHMIDADTALAEQKTRELRKILAEMTRQLSESSGGIENSSNILETYAEKLYHAVSLDTITEIAKNIVAETKSIIKSSKTLKDQLDSTNSKIDVLSKKMEGLKKTSRTDMLTGLLNRYGFDESMDRIFEDKETPHDPLCVIMVDIDHFKKVNDTYGHLVGDSVLKMLGKLLKDHIKGRDIAARFGGEEFLLVLPKTPIEGAHSLAEQIRSNLAKMKLTIKDTGKPIGQITISLGVSLHKNGESIDDAIERADNALYQAKNTGRNKTITQFDLDH